MPCQWLRFRTTTQTSPVQQIDPGTRTTRADTLSALMGQVFGVFGAGWRGKGEGGGRLEALSTRSDSTVCKVQAQSTRRSTEATQEGRS